MCRMFQGCRRSLLWNSCDIVMAFIFLQDSVYNLDPEKPEMMDDFTAAMLEKEGKELSDLETEIVEAPFVQVLVNSYMESLLPF